MNIEKELDGSKLKIKLSGRLDTNTSPILEKELEKDLSNVKVLIFDFEELMYISSAGLRAMLLIQKTINNQGEMVIENVNDLIMEVFDTTGFTDILTIK